MLWHCVDWRSGAVVVTLHDIRQYDLQNDHITQDATQRNAGLSRICQRADIWCAMQGQMVGSILFASNATTAAEAATAAASLATNSSAYNLLLTQSATTALNAWMTSNTSAAILSSSSYAGLAVPTNFTYTLLNVTNVAVINATVANSTVESLLNITSSSSHYAMDVWLNVTVQVGYSVALNSSVTSGRRLLQYGWASADAHDQLAFDSSPLALPGGGPAADKAWSSDQYAQADHGRVLSSDSNQSTDSAQGLPSELKADASHGVSDHSQAQLSLPALTASAAMAHGRRQLQQSISFSWTSPLDLQLALWSTAFTESSQCNATAVALQLDTSSSVSSLNCTSSTSTTLLTDLLAAASTGSTSALTVLMLSTTPTSSRSTSTVDNNAGIEASLNSGISILLQSYQVEIAELVAMTITAIDTVDELGASMASSYIKSFITTAQNYIDVTTTFVNDVLVIFGKTVTASSAIVSASAYTTLVQTALAEAASAENALVASTTFQAAVAALAPNCTSRDSLGNVQFTFLLAANETQESFANSSDTAAASTTTAVANETASDCPKALVDKTTGYCVNSWNGYPVTQVSSIPARKAVGEQVIGRRHMVGFDGNVVVGGLLIHQVMTGAVGHTCNVCRMLACILS